MAESYANLSNLNLMIILFITWWKIFGRSWRKNWIKNDTLSWPFAAQIHYDDASSLFEEIHALISH